MNRKNCNICCGSGKVQGLFGWFVECRSCDGHGYHLVAAKPKIKGDSITGQRK